MSFNKKFFTTGGIVASAPAGLDPLQNFEPVIYTGNGGTQSISSLDFQPDLVWIKARDGDASHPISDSVRGEWKTLYANSAAAEEDLSTSQIHGVTSFNSNGFTIKDVNNGNYGLNGALGTTYGGRYVAWCWKAGGAAVLNEEGDIDSQVSANQDAGFSIVKQTSNNTNDTYGHGLDEAPEMIISKNMDVEGSWGVYHKDLGTGKWLYLNQTDAVGTSSTVFPIVNNTVFSGGSGGWNYSTSNYINYCFHSVDGYQKVGSYQGSGVAGNAQSIGFQPKFILGKSYDNAEDWFIVDSSRGGNKYLKPNLSNAEATAGASITFTSTGFEFTGGSFNNSGMNFIYLAIA